jgi:hypothetical protein
MELHVNDVTSDEDVVEFFIYIYYGNTSIYACA